MTIDATWLKANYGDPFAPRKPNMNIRSYPGRSVNPIPNRAGWESDWHFFTSALAKFATHPYEKCQVILDRCYIFNRHTGELKQEIWFE